MSDFVNYNKRGINLPSGNNLADVLVKRCQSLSEPALPLGDLKLEKLSSVGVHVSQAWQSSSPGFHLNVRPGKPIGFNGKIRLRFIFEQLPSGSRKATFWVLTEDEAAMRGFLKDFGYALPDSSVLEHVMSEEVICKISLPDDSNKLTSLITAVFRRVGSLNDDSDITVYYKEDNFDITKLKRARVSSA